jgi:hypothetical protein
MAQPGSEAGWRRWESLVVTARSGQRRCQRERWLPGRRFNADRTINTRHFQAGASRAWLACIGGRC